MITPRVLQALWPAGRYIDWQDDQWERLRLIAGNLGDEEFLRQFQPILDTYARRGPYLERCARSLASMYDLRDCRLLEPASGPHGLPALLRSLGCNAVGLEAQTSMAARYCSINGLPLITSERWDSDWTDQQFDLIVVVMYFTAPDSSEWASRVTQGFCQSVFRQISNGAELILFDWRYARPLRRMIESQSWPLESVRKFGVWQRPTIFFRSGTRSARRKWS